VSEEGRSAAAGLLTHIAARGKRFVVRADEKLTAFLELERAVCIHVLTEQVLAACNHVSAAPQSLVLIRLESLISTNGPSFG
jgi:hypothetical protein